MKKITLPKNVVDASEAVDGALRVLRFSRSRAESADGGAYVILNSVAPAIIFAVVLLIIEALSVIKRSSLVKGGTMLSAIEILSSAAICSNLVMAVVTVCNENEKNIRMFIAAQALVDRALGIDKSDVYSGDKFLMNLTFFGITTLRSLAFLIEITGLTYLLEGTYYLYSKWFIVLLLRINCIGFAAKLNILRRRTRIMHEQISDSSLCSKLEESEVLSNVRRNLDGEKFKWCYMGMLQNCSSFNVIQGLQVLLLYWDMLLSTIRVVQLSTTFTTAHLGAEIMLPLTIIISLNFIVELVVFIALLYQLTSIASNMDKVTDLIERCLIKNLFESERERQHWRELVELAHRQPLRFTAYDFFPLDWSLLGAMAATMLTYTVILLQNN